MLEILDQFFGRLIFQKFNIKWRLEMQNFWLTAPSSRKKTSIKLSFDFIGGYKIVKP